VSSPGFCSADGEKKSESTDIKLKLRSYLMSQTTNKKLYVGSLPYSVTEDELRDLFAPYGQIESVRIITDKFTGQSKGFGFVEMSNDDEAQKAVAAVNGQQMNGRTLIVNEARPEQRRERSFGGGAGGPGGNRNDRGGGDRWGEDRPRRPRREF
jgi:RNA recognition motif-containing protein